MSRAATILGRFPAHLEAGGPGKRIGEVTAALARPLELLAADLAAVRRAHRAGEADEIVDLLRLAALHGLGGADFAPLLLRLAGAGYSARLEALRARLFGAIRFARQGQGTVRALLDGAAGALGLVLGPIEHSRHRFWHAAFVTDTLAPKPVPGAPAPPREVIGLEENPLHRETGGLEPRLHGETWTLRRRGFGPVRLDVAFRGREGRSVGPMLVQRDQGFGVGYAGSVPAGSLLTFEDDGRVLLDGADASPLAYAWRGACFAGEDASPERDFVFPADAAAEGAPRAVRFARSIVAGEADPFAPATRFPLPARPLGTPDLNVGETRFAAFVQVAHFSAREEREGGIATLPVAPRTAIGTFDASVFAAPPAAPPAVDVELAWMEHEAYAVRLLLPRRFAALAGDEAQSAATLSAALVRSRAAGIDLRVDFVDPGLVLDDSALPAGAEGGPLAELWARAELGGAPGGPDI